MRCSTWLLVGIVFSNACLKAQEKPFGVESNRYEYETKPDDEAFAIFNPAKAPSTAAPLLKPGDRLAIVGDSITEQKMYSRIIESYLVACRPDLKISVRQYGWSGEKTDGFLRRMDRDCLSMQPTVATICYGMNDARYRPFDTTNGRWFRDHLGAIIRRFKEHDVRVVVGSPGCSGKIATWVKSKAGTLQEHNLHLCALRDIALEVATAEQLAFADIFWPMLQSQVLAPKRFKKSPEDYAVAGKDGIHPGWAGHTIMAFAFLIAMGLDGDLGTIYYDVTDASAAAKGMHRIVSSHDGEIRIASSQYPFCATGAIDDDNSIRSGMALVPFADRLNRFTLKVRGLQNQRVRVTWGESTVEFSSAEATDGINLADRFEVNPFTLPFQRVDAAVLKKQTFETDQIKKVFHGQRGTSDFGKAVAETEAERAPLAEAVTAAVVPIEHALRIEVLE